MDRTFYCSIFASTSSKFSSSSASSSRSSPSAHIHTDDHCNDKDGRTKPDTTGNAGFIRDTKYRTFNPHSERGRTLGTRHRGLQFQNRIRPRGLLSDYERIRERTRPNTKALSRNQMDVYTSRLSEKNTLEGFT
ncbi:hypothetical protein LR48_Vigan08g143400 [Vigna angularis]|uniref:Uncharacterized protein n=1 Tax=Phaseolus angularis TaxID=3914 RepID=A0A0L9V6Q6_PHAAN|nr:hypothetical protein LR48_Vigan08g143400 [Vigna angularis]